MSYFERVRKTNTVRDTTCLIDEKGIEFLIAWRRDYEGMTLESVEVVIAGRGIDILNSLSQHQYDAICEQITSEI